MAGAEPLNVELVTAAREPGQFLLQGRWSWEQSSAGPGAHTVTQAAAWPPTQGLVLASRLGARRPRSRDTLQAGACARLLQGASGNPPTPRPERACYRPPPAVGKRPSI